jgi:hypothetical protein
MSVSRGGHLDTHREGREEVDGWVDGDDKRAERWNEKRREEKRREEKRREEKRDKTKEK